MQILMNSIQRKMMSNRVRKMLRTMKAQIVMNGIEKLHSQRPEVAAGRRRKVLSCRLGDWRLRRHVEGDARLHLLELRHVGQRIRVAGRRCPTRRMRKCLLALLASRGSRPADDAMKLRTAYWSESALNRCLRICAAAPTGSRARRDDAPAEVGDPRPRAASSAGPDWPRDRSGSGSPWRRSWRRRSRR